MKIPQETKILKQKEILPVPQKVRSYYLQMYNPLVYNENGQKLQAQGIQERR